MKKIISGIAFFCLFSFSQPGKAQSYFPPLSGNWDTVSPVSLGWCISDLPQFYHFLDSTNTRGFIVLKNGRIVIEKYFNNHGPDSLWYWASAAKSLVAYLYGILQQNKSLTLGDKSSDYLGKGWTSAPPAKEDLITVHHQLSMSCGLDDREFNCLVDTCLKYLSDAGTRWSYHNGPYRLLIDILENVSGKTRNRFTRDSIGNRIGMGGFWLGYLRYGTARDMARFGLLALNNGVWDTDTILNDTAYLGAMTRPSQNINPSYGYLWWLNGRDTVMFPGSQLRFPTDLVSNAPLDMYAALGANDQKIYVVPSQDLVVVRIGDAPDTSTIAPSIYDSEIWTHLNKLICTASSRLSIKQITVFPNPGMRERVLRFPVEPGENAIISLSDLKGKQVYSKKLTTDQNQLHLNLPALPSGMYVLRVELGERKKPALAKIIFH